MHGKLEIAFGSAAELAVLTQALAWLPKDRLTWEERGALASQSGWRWRGSSWLTPDGTELREYAPAELERLRCAAAECAGRAAASAGPAPPVSAAPPIPGPTPRDAVAGMLLRCRWGSLAS